MPFTEYDDVVNNWQRLAAERGWDDETLAAHLEANNSRDLAAFLRSRATPTDAAPKARKADDGVSQTA